MSAVGKVRVWVCAVLAAMPLSPCAFVMGACPADPHQAVSVDLAVSAASCCTTHGDPQRPANRPAPDAPCRGDCCRAVPLVPAAEKPVSAWPALSLVAASEPFGDSASGRFVPLAGPFLQQGSLRILQCRWRC